MIQSDNLSRRPDHIPDEDHDNEDRVLLPDSIFVRLLDNDLQDLIADSDHWDQLALDALNNIQKNGPTTLTNDLKDWVVKRHNNKLVLFYRDKNYILDSLSLRQEILRRHHDHLTAGHPGETETYQAVQRHYWWPGMRLFVKNYVKGCAHCQQFKINRNPSHPSLIATQGPKSDRPFAQVYMDFITDLPESNGYDAILSLVDQGLSKGVIIIPCNKTCTELQLAVLLIDNLFKRFGLPDSFTSDRGPQFAARVFREMLRLLKIESRLSTAFRPQTDGVTE